MAIPKSPSNDGPPASSPPRSTAQQVMYWLILVSLLVAVAVMGTWWMASALPITVSTTFILMFAIGGLWATVYQLLVLGIKRMVRSRIARSNAERG